MKPIQTAEIARAVANISNARGNASAVTLSKLLLKQITETFQEQLLKKNVTVIIQSTNEGAFGEMVRPRVLELLEAAENSLSDAALPQRFHAKVARVKEQIQDDENFDGVAASVRLEELVYDLLAELTEPQFFRISIDKRRFFEQTEPLFGASVDAKFPKSSRDIAAAGRCFAFGEWTACVYHLMRAVEEPLHVLATKVNVVFPKPIEFENWKNIVDKIDAEITKEVKRLEGTSASHQRNDELKLYGEAALQIRHFKNAWRNDAAHGREHYDDKEAERVYNAVKHFMEKMAEIA